MIYCHVVQSEDLDGFFGCSLNFFGRAVAVVELDDQTAVVQRQYVGSTAQFTGLQCDVQALGEPLRLPPRAEVNIYRMVQEALDAFARMDTEQAFAVAREDKAVDQEYKTAMREMVTFMMEDPRSIGRVLNILWVLRSLERVGDHARNIAEHVIYLVKGTDVRHIGLKRMEAEVKMDGADE